MKKLFPLILCIFLVSLLSGNKAFLEENENPKTALLLIDIQNFYFPGGRSSLVNPEEASLKASKLLNHFRQKGLMVIHVRHETQPGGEIHEHVKPLETEKVISKNHANAFKDTDLLAYLRSNSIERLAICGMMTHMCVEAATRAAHDFDFECIVVHDACATRSLKFQDREIPAEDVHYSTLASLSRYYARVVDTETFLKESED
ncbi:MAG: isochorismatase family protein [Candidatus Aminicenantes bacterium]|nr:isochorismatase family protein [Candidatus Aminicenantes bacterium]